MRKKFWHKYAWEGFCFVLEKYAQTLEENDLFYERLHMSQDSLDSPDLISLTVSDTKHKTP